MLEKMISLSQWLMRLFPGQHFGHSLYSVIGLFPMCCIIPLNNDNLSTLFHLDPFPQAVDQ